MLYWISMVFGSIGAGAIIFALTSISLVIGVLVNSMIVLMAGPIVDKFIKDKN